MVAVTTYHAKAVHWSGGWELHVHGVGVTQVRSLAKAEQQVRDLVETMTGEDATSAEVVIAAELDGLEVAAQKAKRAAERAARDQVQAAKDARRVARALRAKGLSVSDTATVMQLSRGRISQLTADAGQKT